MRIEYKRNTHKLHHKVKQKEWIEKKAKKRTNRRAEDTYITYEHTNVNT